MPRPCTLSRSFAVVVCIATVLYIGIGMFTASVRRRRNIRLDAVRASKATLSKTQYTRNVPAMTKQLSKQDSTAFVATPNESQYTKKVNENEPDSNMCVMVMSARGDFNRRQAIRETWARNMKNVWFMVGKEACGIPLNNRKSPYGCSKKEDRPIDTNYRKGLEREQEMLMREIERYKNLVLLPMVDYYRALPHKLKLGYDWCLKHTNAQWFVKIDDDAYMRVARLEEELKGLDYTQNILAGTVRRGSGVPHSGKWKEFDFYKKEKYPPFANGAQGHVVTRRVAREIVDFDGQELQGEDVSLGDWIDQLHLPDMKILHRPDLFSLGNCMDKRKVVVGHNISPTYMKQCWMNTQARVYGTLIGRLGNQLFQWASLQGIASKNGMSTCVGVKDEFQGSSIFSVFTTIPNACSVKQSNIPHVGEAGKYATYRDLHFKNSVVVDGYLQSYKYFPPDLYDRLKIRDTITAKAKAQITDGKTNIGIHVRHMHQAEVDYLRFPPNDYFENVMSQFRRDYPNAFFYVASDDVAWCRQQTFFQKSDVKIIENDPGLDMAVLASCDHMVLTVGTFGWWAAFLGAHRNGGKVVYYKEEFVMEHKVNKGNVVKEDFYPKGWISNEQLIRKHARCKSTIVTAYFDIPSKHSKTEYVTWMENMLSLQDAMVIFTSSDMVSTIMAFRSHAIDKTHVIVLDIHDIFGAKVKDELFWKHQLEMDPEKNIHQSYQLFWIWLSKSWFVTETIQKNPFSSEIFVWMDIGSFRTKEYNNKKLILHEELIPETAMLIMATHAPTNNDNKFILKSRDVVWVAGAHMAGRSIVWKKFHAAFSLIMQGYITNNLFVGEDQAVIQSTCQNHPSLCNVVTPELVKGNKWFGLSYFLNVGTGNAIDNDIPIGGGKQKCVFITGMGHSGTSLVSGLLGARTDEDQTDKWHPSGLYEARDFIDINEKIMNHHKLDIRGTQYVNAIDKIFLQSLDLTRFLTDIYKDPRLIFTWPYWKTACQSSGTSPIAIFVYRNAACSCNHPNCPNCGGDCFGRHVNHLNNMLRVEPDTYFFDIDKFFRSPWKYYTKFINMLRNQGVFVEKPNLDHFKSIYSQRTACESQLSIGSSFSFFGKTSVVTKQMFITDWKITHCSNIRDTQTVVVTALWDIARETNGDGRKYSDYIQWFKKTLTLNSSIFIFSDKKTIEIVRGEREKLKLPTCYMTMDINDHPFYDLFFKKNKRIVTSSDYISKVPHPGRVEVKNPYYNIIQWGKVELLKIALHDYNPFNSQYAVWIDAGISRFFPKDIPKKSFPSFNNPLLTNAKGLSISTKYGLNDLQSTCSNEMEWKSKSYLLGTLLITEKSQVYNFSQLWKSHIGSMLREQKSANDQIALLSLWCKDPTQMSIVKTQEFWSSFITIQQSLFQNTRFEQISPPSVKKVCSNADFVPSQKISVWTMLTDGSDYTEGAFKLGASVQRFTSIALDLVVMELSSKPLSNNAWLRLRNAGWQKCVVDRIAPLDEKGTFGRFRDQFTKLHAWGMTMYNTLLYLDSDTLVLHPIDGLLQTDLGEKRIGVARDYGAGKWRPTFNMGVFIIHPNTKEYERLLSLQKSGKIKFQTSMSEQGFLNVVYKNDWYDIGFEHNANLAIFSQDRSYWDKHERDIRIVHFTMNKPWKCSHEYSHPCSWWLNSI